MINSFYSPHLNVRALWHTVAQVPVPFCVTTTCFALSEIPATATWRHSQADSSQLVKAHLMDFVICCIKKTNKTKVFFFYCLAFVYCASATYLLLLDCWYVMHVWYRGYVNRTRSDFLQKLSS